MALIRWIPNNCLFHKSVSFLIACSVFTGPHSPVAGPVSWRRLLGLHWLRLRVYSYERVETHASWSTIFLTSSMRFETFFSPDLRKRFRCSWNSSPSGSSSSPPIFVYSVTEGCTVDQSRIHCMSSSWLSVGDHKNRLTDLVWI